MFEKFNFENEYIHCVPDESLIGKRVLFGDTWTDIKGQVESNNWTSCRRTLKSIDYESCCPFIIDNNFKTGQYKFIYYDPEWEEKTTYYCYLDRDINPIQFMFYDKKPSSHIYATFIDACEATKWCRLHDKFAEIAKVWEDGKTIQYFNESAKWIDCAYNKPCWELGTEYRVKPNEPVEVETSKGKMYLANGAEISKKRRMTNRELAKWLAQGKGQWMGASCTICMSYNYNADNNKVPNGIMIRSWDETEWHEPEVEMR